MRLQRSISTVGLLLTSVGCMVGSGWLFGAYYAAQIAGPSSVLSWLLGGVMVAFIALTFSEISSMLPVAGGIARYSHFSHGSLVSFCMSWLAWLSCVAVAPTEVQAILQYSSGYFPGLVIKQQGVHVLTMSGFAIASVLMLLISLLNIMGIKLLTCFNALITWGKLLIPLVVVIVIMYHHFSVTNFTAHGFASGGLHGILWALPTAGIVFSFLGFREATSLAGEAKSPGVAVPIAVLGSVFICSLLYVFLQIGFIGAVSPQALAEGWAHLNYAGDSGPFAGIAASLGLGFLVLLIYADALVSPFGTAVIYTTTTARLNYAMSFNRYTPAFMLQLNQRGVPVLAVVVNCLLGLFMFLPFPTWQALVGFQSIAIVLAYAVGPVTLLCLRHQLPKLRRPFVLPASKTLCVITFYFCNLIAYWTGWETIWRLMFAIMFGGILFAIQRSCDKKMVLPLQWRSALWLLPYFTTLTLISYLGNFGSGKAVIPFGWDFLVIFVFSLCFIYIAFRSRLSAQTSQEILAHDQEMKDFLIYDEPLSHS